MGGFLDAVVSKLPSRVQPYAKAVVPLVLAGAVVVQDLTIDAAEVNTLAVAAGGVVTSLIVAAVPNKP